MSLVKPKTRGEHKGNHAKSEHRKTSIQIIGMVVVNHVMVGAVAHVLGRVAAHAVSYVVPQLRL